MGEAIDDMAAKAMSHGQAWMVEVVGWVIRHPDQRDRNQSERIA
ncbi:MAG: hypothetical protein ACYDAL_16155 [Candidatus Dormibacteraceae bacterium]